MNYIKPSLTNIYNLFDKQIHDIFRKNWAKHYSIGQLNDAKKNYPNWKTLTKEQKREIAEYWGLEHPVESDFMTHEIMLNARDDYDVRYVPEKIFRLYIDPTLSDRKITWAWDDKNYYEYHYPTLNWPYTYVRNIAGYFVDHDYRSIDRDKAIEIIMDNLPVIIKPSLLSGEGKNVRLISNKNEAREIFSLYDRDYLVQRVIKQCALFEKTNPHSVNTMRIVTAIVNGKAKFLSGMLLTNTTDVIACNTNKGPGEGVVCIGIDDKGQFFETGYYENAKRIKVLPNGFHYAGLEVPAYKEAVKRALEAHERVPMLGIIGWDITIDENNRPVFIEGNLKGIGMYHSQLATGPLFGEYSDHFAGIARKLIKNWNKK